MKLKRSRQARSCKDCGAVIAKGDLYGQRTKSIVGEDSINGGKDWRPTRISFKVDVCECCSGALVQTN